MFELQPSDEDVGHPNDRVRAAVTTRLSKSLAPLLLEHADFRAAGLAVYDADDLRVRDEGSAGEHLPSLFFQEQHLIEGDLLADLGLDAIDRDHGTRAHLDLPTTR